MNGLKHFPLGHRISADMQNVMDSGLLPPKTEKHYSTRTRPHKCQLPRQTSVLDECNFMYRVLYRGILPFMH